MRVLGITGGVGSGKSEILTYLEKEYGAAVCRMDDVARNLQRKGEECYQKIIEHFGNCILGEDGELDRNRLGKIVFNDREQLEALNRIVHPAVLEWVKKDIREKAETGKKIYVAESALLTEEVRALCDEWWYIFTRESVRRERLRISRDYSDERITQMIASQADEKTFREICDAVIDNSGRFEDTKKQIGEKLKL